MKPIAPIYNRTQADIIAKNARAYLNVVDILRIQANSHYTYRAITALAKPKNTNVHYNQYVPPSPYAVVLGSFYISQNWALIITNSYIRATTANLPFTYDASNYVLYQGKYVYRQDHTTRPLNFTMVNDLEWTIYQIWLDLPKTVEYRVYCGVAAVGQARSWQHRFRPFPDWYTATTYDVRKLRSGAFFAGASRKLQHSFRRYT